MAGVQLQIRPDGLEAINDYITGLARALGDTRPLLEAVGAVAESQTRRRLGEDKEGPDGEAWPEWSERYARTRHRGHRLLENEGDLLDSIHYVAGPDTAEVGSGLVYAAIHQFGGEEAGQPALPARPFLGVGAPDAVELLDVMGDFGRRAMEGRA